MGTHTPFEAEVLKKLGELGSDLSIVKSDVGELKGDVAGLKTDVSELKTDMIDVKGRLISLEDRFLDMSEEMRSESAATRALLNQAFEHISDQLARDDRSVPPSVVFRARRHTTAV